MAKKKTDSEKLAEKAVKGIQAKKGKNILSLDLRKIDNAVADFFIICHGSSRTQVEAICYGILETVDKELDMDPWHKEGMENAEWILLDYVDVVIHIFESSKRDFYKLESLWADADIKAIKDLE